MKNLDLKVLKSVLICEDDEDDDVVEMNIWIENNIGEGEVSVKEWLEEFNNYWKEWSDDYGDSGVIQEILEEVYKLEENEVDEIMSIYWDCDNVEEYIEDYKG
jgi:hypothetical protein